MGSRVVQQDWVTESGGRLGSWFQPLPLPPVQTRSERPTGPRAHREKPPCALGHRLPLGARPQPRKQVSVSHKQPSSTRQPHPCPSGLLAPSPHSLGVSPLFLSRFQSQGLRVPQMQGAGGRAVHPGSLGPASRPSSRPSQGRGRRLSPSATGCGCHLPAPRGIRH